MLGIVHKWITSSSSQEEILMPLTQPEQDNLAANNKIQTLGKQEMPLSSSRHWIAEFNIYKIKQSKLLCKVNFQERESKRRRLMRRHCLSMRLKIGGKNSGRRGRQAPDKFGIAFDPRAKKATKQLKPWSSLPICKCHKILWPFASMKRACTTACQYVW